MDGISCDDLHDRLQVQLSLEEKVHSGEKLIITPDDVLKFTKATDGYLCPPLVNEYNIDFTSFMLKDPLRNDVLFSVTDSAGLLEENSLGIAAIRVDGEMRGTDSVPALRFFFKPEFLKLKDIEATIEFTIGNRSISNLRLIERHYFRDQLLRSFDFPFGYVLANSSNSFQHIYNVPQLDPDLEAAMIANPFETKSDSFYFVDSCLIMHNKAEYSYNGARNSTADQAHIYDQM